MYYLNFLKGRGEGSKKCVFVHAQGIKTVTQEGGGGKKKTKFCPRNCWMTPMCNNRCLSIFRIFPVLYHGARKWEKEGCTLESKSFYSQIWIFIQVDNLKKVPFSYSFIEKWRLGILHSITILEIAKHFHEIGIAILKGKS